MIDLTQTKTLFLDRDGVINVERKNDYAKNVDEFIFIDNVLDAIAILSEKFHQIFVVTNQRGVGRGVMSKADLDSVHTYMLKNIEAHGGKVSEIYVCTDLDETSSNRKPNTGMGFLAQSEYPNINFEHSIMVGNSRSDIEFGNNLGMKTILVGDKYAKDDEIYNNICAYFPNLYQFALSL